MNHGESLDSINDCFSSGPEAVLAMLEVLQDTSAWRRVAAREEMLDLGHWADPLSRGVGNYNVESGLNVLVGLRGAASHRLDAAKRAGLGSGAAFFFEDRAGAGCVEHLLAPPPKKENDEGRR